MWHDNKCFDSFSSIIVETLSKPMLKNITFLFHIKRTVFQNNQIIILRNKSVEEYRCYLNEENMFPQFFLTLTQKSIMIMFSVQNKRENKESAAFPKVLFVSFKYLLRFSAHLTCGRCYSITKLIISEFHFTQYSF